MRTSIRALIGLSIIVPVALALGRPAAGQTDARPERSDAEVYAAACANCHGGDGRGLEQALVGFEEPLPDFTDCGFASREQVADWVAIGHEGGPVRGFSAMMPAFAGALSADEITQAVHHIKSFCTDPSWPRGELNLPRAILTEKAFPEDEWVVEADAGFQSNGDVSSAFVWEQRFGPKSQFEVVFHYGWAEVPDAGGSAGSTKWVSGFGDLVLGLKHTLFHDGGSGSILSVGGEVVLPTGDEAKGFGGPGTATEGFLSFGQLLPSEAFIQAQAGVERPLYEGGEAEAFGRIVLGRTFAPGRWGRIWTPMIEVQGKGELGGGAIAVDVVPELQVSLSARQHVRASVGALVPATETSGRGVRLLAYVLLDWFDGGFFEGW